MLKKYGKKQKKGEKMAIPIAEHVDCLNMNAIQTFEMS